MFKLTLATVLFLQTAAAPVVIGQHPDALTPADVSDIAALFAGRGTVWIVDATTNGEATLATVYLKPDRTGSGIRRGSLAMVSKGRSGALPVPRPWIMTELTGAREREYAQVLIEGRDADDVRDATDENRPFKVTGDFSDQDLVGLVRFLRVARSGSGPILRISRQTSSFAPPGADAVRIDIMMPRVPNCYEIVTVWRTGSGWQQASGGGGACP